MSEAARQIPAVEIPSKPQTFTAKAFAARSATNPLAPFTLPRRSPRPQDVQIEILYCGVCHSDLHQVRNEWKEVMPTVYPCVPGHEIVGRVVKVGSAVKKFKEGDIAAVGCMVDSCRVCASCRAGEEQYCENFFTLTYNGEDKILGGVTYGGYSDSIVVDEAYVLHVSNKLNPAGTAPLLCAGITTYSPLRHIRFVDHDAVGIESQAEMQKHAGTFNFILDAVSADHDINAYISLLKRDGTLTLVGAPEKPLPVSAFSFLMGRRRLAGSAIGGIKETQEMLDFCADHDITSDIELIPIQRINEAYERLLKSDVKYRFVIDMASLK